MAMKPKTITCRLTDGDYRMLLDNSASLELTQSEYIRYLIRIPIACEGLENGERCIVLDTETFGRMYSELVRWGRHYNQAVRAMNTIALHMRRGKWDPDLFGEQIAKANTMLEKTEAGRAEVLGEMERLEALALIGG